ncbi:substrate-binding periplasmic protein [Roseateles sp. BYS78W]|uniref:Substrate-binding periplasmic protein n=1 Tax=Pelomonas candidula TaxID=3299025 RepID=A0ABW7HAH7_9BURK
MPGHETTIRQRGGRRRWLALAVAMLCGGAAAQASCDRPLKVAVSDLGLGSYQEQGQIRGLIPDLVNELQTRTGCPFQLVFLPRARALLDFDRGAVDIITSMLRTPERDRVGAHLPYGYTKHDLLVVPEAATGLRGLADIVRRPELTLGVVRGIRTNSRIDAHLEQLLAIRRAEYSPDFTNLGAKLAARRVQVALMPNAVHVKMRRDGTLPADLVIVDEPEARPQVLGLYVNRQAVPVRTIALLDQRLTEMVKTGWVRQCYAQHFGEAETRRMDNALKAN